MDGMCVRVLYAAAHFLSFDFSMSFVSFFYILFFSSSNIIPAENAQADTFVKWKIPLTEFADSVLLPKKKIETDIINKIN